MNENTINYLIDKCRTRNIYKPREAGLLKILKYLISNKTLYLYNYKRFDEMEYGIPREFIRLEPNELLYLKEQAQKSKKGIVEIGRYFGGSTAVLNFANKHVPIYSIDLDPQDDAFLKNILENINENHKTELIVSDSQKDTFEKITDYDLLFIDGDHTYEGCLADLNNWWENLSVYGDILLHDSYKTDKNGVADSISDFIKSKQNNVKVINFPSMLTKWQSFRTKFGSLTHLRKV